MRTFQQLREAVLDLQYEHGRRSEQFAHFIRTATQAVRGLMERKVALNAAEDSEEGTINLDHLGKQMRLRFLPDLKSERFRVGLENLDQESETGDHPILAAVFVDRDGNIFESENDGESNAGIAMQDDVARTIMHLLLVAAAN